MKKFKDFTEEEQIAFSKDFYACWKRDSIIGQYDADAVDGNACPWGCPWFYAEDEKSVSGDEWFATCRDEIIEALQNEDENSDQE